MALGVNALVSVDDVKAFIGQTKDGLDATLEIIIDGVSLVFNQYTGRDLAYRETASMKVNGNGTTRLYLPTGPIVSIASVTVDGIAVVENTDFVIWNDIAMLETMIGYDLEAGIWSKGVKNIVMTTVKAGYVAMGATANVPADLKKAAIIQASFEAQTAIGKEWGVESRSIGGGSTSRYQEGLLPEVRAILDSYRRGRF